MHAIRLRPPVQRQKIQSATLEEEEPSLSDEASKPLNETLLDLQLESEERLNITDEGRQQLVFFFFFFNETPCNPVVSSPERVRAKAHFFVHCSQCDKLCNGKLRVRCALCKGGAFTVHRDPECWDDVLKSRRIPGHCESLEVACVDNAAGDPPFAEFFFKCAEHVSGGEKDFAAPLNLIKNNIKNVPCLACTDVR